MPTPSAIRDIVRHRTNVAISLGEATRLARAAAGCQLSTQLEARGRDVNTGAAATTVISVGDLLTAPPPPETHPRSPVPP